MTEAEKVANHLKEIMAVLERNEPSEVFMRELLEKASAVIPGGDLSPNMEKWKRAAFKKLPKLLLF